MKQFTCSCFHICIFFLAAVLKVSADVQPLEFCECGHRITASLEGVIDPLVITLPHPILPIFRFKSSNVGQSANTIDLVLVKALEEHWPGDLGIRRRNKQSAWNLDHDLKPTTDLESLVIHYRLQLSNEDCRACQKRMKKSGKPEIFFATDPLTSIRGYILVMFIGVEKNCRLNYRIKIEGSEGEDSWKDEWFFRIHLPIRISPQGTPLMIVTAVDLRQAERMMSRGNLDRNRFEEECERIFGHRDEMLCFPFYTAGETRHFRYILRLNSTRIQPTEWQKENVPLLEDPTSPWLATFIQPLYQDFHKFHPLPRHSSSTDTGASCGKCRKKADNLKLCGRCMAVSYCCVECQRAAWPKHKPLCCIKT